MIHIENINYDRFFPTVDFVVRNERKSTLILWQFSIHIRRCVIDPSPSLSFSLSLDNSDPIFRISSMAAGSLKIEVQNNGWGAAKNAEFRLEEPSLRSIFASDYLRYTGTVNSGEKKEIYRLAVENIDSQLFLRTYKDSMKRARQELEIQLPEFLKVNNHLTPEHGYPEGYLDWSYQEHKKEKIDEFKRQWYLTSEDIDQDQSLDSGSPTIPILAPSIQWRCVDEWDVPVNGNDILPASVQDGALYLSPEGFIQRRSNLQYADRETEVQYCVIAEPQKKMRVSSFPVSRKIEAGKEERFSIMIGASQSCLMETAFSFTLDDDVSIDSESFQINIWNPMNSQWERKYRDGDKMRQYAMDLESRTVLDSLEKSDQELMKELRWLEDRLQDYPFQRSA